MIIYLYQKQGRERAVIFLVHFIQLSIGKYNSTKELTNWDGTYQRLVYNIIKHLFYNDYFVEHYDFNRNKKLNIKNPLMLFGVESAKTTGSSML